MKRGCKPCHQDDPIAARICELFDEMEPLEKIFGENNNEEAAEPEEPAVKLRAKPAKGGGIFGRKKQTVSGYFSDWTKWLRGSEVARGGGGDGTATPVGMEGSADRRAAKCNGRE